MLDGPFSDLHKAGVPFLLCVHLEDKGLSFKGAVWTARQSKTGFSIWFFLDQSSGASDVDPDKKTKKKCKRRETSLRKAKEGKNSITPPPPHQNLGMKVPNATPISATPPHGSQPGHQCVTRSVWN